MSEGKIKVEIVTPEKHAFEGTVDAVNIPGSRGEFGVLPQHRPMLNALATGVVTLQEGEAKSYLVIGPGFADVLPDHVTILTDRCEAGGDLSTDDARKQFDEIEKNYLAFSGDTRDVEFKELELDYLWARSARDASELADK